MYFYLCKDQLLTPPPQNLTIPNLPPDLNSNSKFNSQIMAANTNMLVLWIQLRFLSSFTIIKEDRGEQRSASFNWSRGLFLFI